MSDNEAKAEAMLKALEDIGAKVFFEKQLTSSDVSASGRVVVPKAVAEQYFPKIDSATGTEIDVEDASGNTYTLRFRFWINNQSRMYLLEGTADLQHQYHLRMGDVLIFAQKEDQTIVLAGRPSTKSDAAKKPPIRKPSPTPAGTRPASGRRETLPRATKDRSTRRRLRAYGLNAEDIEAPADGVFRAVPAAGLSDQPSAVSAVRDARWVASLNLAGELYQAFFDNEDDALEAFNAAGFEQPVAAAT
eukprot:jgi/Chrzof1/11049/Cz05g21210.t1